MIYEITRNRTLPYFQKLFGKILDGFWLKTEAHITAIQEE